MNEENALRQRHRIALDRPATGAAYTAKDFQLEVLNKLAEMQDAVESMEESWNQKLEAVKEQRLLKFDSRTLVALGAVALSITGYVIQDARNTARQDSEIEAMRARLVRLEQIAATNTEGRIKTDVELGQLREGQAEIKGLIQAHDNASRRGPAQKSEGRGQ